MKQPKIIANFYHDDGPDVTIHSVKVSIEGHSVESYEMAIGATARHVWSDPDFQLEFQAVCESWLARELNRQGVGIEKILRVGAAQKVQ